MSRRPLYLHVGCSKSGTTSLQQSVYQAREQLLREGVGLPLPSRPEQMRLLYTPLAGPDLDRDAPEVQQRMSELEGVLAQAEGERLLLSLEDLAELDEQAIAVLREALRDFDLHLVITARDWARQIPSEWQQGVKARLTVPYHDFVQEIRDGLDGAGWFLQRQDVPAIARRWGAGLAPDRVHVIAVPPATPDPRASFRLFADVVGFDPDVLGSTKPRNNSLGYEQAETLRRVNLALGDRLADVEREYRPAARRLLLGGAMRRRSGASAPLPPEHVEWCRQQCRAMLDELLGRGYHVVGDTDDLLVRAEVGLTPVPEVSDADVARVAVDALAFALAEPLPRGARPRRAKAERTAGEEQRSGRWPLLRRVGRR